MRSLTVCPASVFEAIGHLLAPSGDHEYPEVVESVFSWKRMNCWAGSDQLEFWPQDQWAFCPLRWFLPFTLRFDTWLLSLGLWTTFSPNCFWWFPLGSECLQFLFKPRKSDPDPKQILDHRPGWVKPAGPSRGKIYIFFDHVNVLYIKTDVRPHFLVRASRCSVLLEQCLYFHL